MRNTLGMLLISVWGFASLWLSYSCEAKAGKRAPGKRLYMAFGGRPVKYGDSLRPSEVQVTIPYQSRWFTCVPARVHKVCTMWLFLEALVNDPYSTLDSSYSLSSIWLSERSLLQRCQLKN